MCLWPGVSAGQTAPTVAPPPITDYIAKGWDSLTRSMTDCATVVDPKVTSKSVLYIPADFAVTADMRELEKRCSVEIRALPKVITKAGDIDTNSFHPQGLLYLPKRYVVPGGRFNEMYGWDSYFIIRGLLETAGSILRATSSKISFSKSSITAAC